MICPGFVASDLKSALLRNIDPALIAYATADMLRRQRQYGKADLKRKEATGTGSGGVEPGAAAGEQATAHQGDHGGGEQSLRK